MALDPILVVETRPGAAIGHCTPVSGLDVYYGGESGMVNYVHAGHLNLSTGKDVYPGQNPGAWPTVLKSNLNTVRGPDWPGETGDVEYQGAEGVGTFGVETYAKVTYLGGDGLTHTST